MKKRLSEITIGDYFKLNEDDSRVFMKINPVISNQHGKTLFEAGTDNTFILNVDNSSITSVPLNREIYPSIF
jgi:hypothetical protein